MQVISTFLMIYETAIVEKFPTYTDFDQNLQFSESENYIPGQTFISIGNQNLLASKRILLINLFI